MMQVLINAYAVNPDWGSEPGMGWNWVIHLAQHCRVHVITEGEWQENIERELVRLPQAGNIVFHYLPVPEKVRRMCWNQGDWRFYHHYRRWQERALVLARKIMEENRIDLIHQLNMIGFREPGMLWKIKGVPYVWGPVGGMENAPVAYLWESGWKRAVQAALKNVINAAQARFQPRVRKAVKRADAVLASVQGVREIMERCHRRKVFLMSETGCFARPDAVRPEKNGREFRLLWAGRMIPTKQLALALKTLSYLRDLPDLKLHVCGGGEKERDCRNLAERLGVEGKCVWHGMVSNEEVQGFMRGSDLFFFPSIMEATSTVLVEALINRLPVLCFDTCGMGTIVDETVGCKIPLSRPGQSARDFAERIRFFFHNRKILQEMDGAFRAKQRELDWNRKAERMAGIYHEILEGHRIAHE